MDDIDPSTDELKSVCLTMVAAGLDTLPGNINMTIAYLSSPHGQEIQERMYKEIVDSHAGTDPWHDCLLEEKSEFVVSFVKVSRIHVHPLISLANFRAGSPPLLVNSQYVFQPAERQRHNLQWCCDSCGYTISHGK
jgi:hypothetical protein